jgi:Tfp pilus assembly major pilin PilA
MTDANSAAREEHTSRLRPLQIAASALAAVTGAFLASRLGVYGTIAGVGVVSVLSTVIGELYLRSLERTRAAATYATIAAKVRATRSTSTDGTPVGLPDRVAGSSVHTEGPAVVAAVDQTADDETTADQTTADHAATDAIATRAVASRLLSRFRELGRLRWPAVAACSVAACVLAALAITGLEAATGSKLSGGEGRTFAGLVVSDEDEPVEESEPGDEQPDDPGELGEDGRPAERQPTGQPLTPTPSPTEPAVPTPTPTGSPQPSTEPGEPPAENDSPEAELPSGGNGDEGLGEGVN